MSDTFRLINPKVRAAAVQAINAAPEGYIVTISEPKRSDGQSRRMWAMIGDVAKAKPEGRQWTKETWRDAFLHYLGHQVQFAQSIDNSGPFPIGFRSSRLSVRQMSDLITCIQQYGDEHGVQWSYREQGWE